MTMAITLFSVTLTACTDEVDSVPTIPASLHSIDTTGELPSGGQGFVLLTHGDSAAMNLLAPRWGRPLTLVGFYTLDRQAMADFHRQLDANMLSKGWKKIDATLSPQDGELLAYALDGGLFSKDRMIAVLLVPVGNNPKLGAEIIANFDFKPPHS